jgi:hypothetical protein
MLTFLALYFLASSPAQDAGRASTTDPHAVDLDLLRVTATFVDRDGQPLAGVRAEAVPMLRTLVQERGWLDLVFGRATSLSTAEPSVVTSDADGRASFTSMRDCPILLRRPGDGLWSLVESRSVGELAERDLGVLRAAEVHRRRLELVEKSTKRPIRGAFVVLAHDEFRLKFGRWLSSGVEAFYADDEKAIGTVWERPEWARDARWCLIEHAGDGWSSGTTDAAGRVTLATTRGWSSVIEICAEGVTYRAEWNEADLKDDPPVRRIELDLGKVARVRVASSGARSPLEYRVAVWAQLSIPDADSESSAKSSIRTDSPVDLGPLSISTDGIIPLRAVPGASTVIATRPRGDVDWSVNKLSAADVSAGVVNVGARHELGVRLIDADGERVSGNVCALPFPANLRICGSNMSLFSLLFPSPVRATAPVAPDEYYRLPDLVEGQHIVVAEASGFEPRFETIEITPGFEQRLAIRMNRIEARRVRFELAHAQPDEKLSSSTVHWRAHDESTLLTMSGEGVLDAESSADVGIPSGWSVVFEGPYRSTSAGSVGKWGSVSSVTLTPNVRIHGRVREGNEALESRYDLILPVYHGEIDRTMDEHVLADPQGRFAFDIPRGTSVRMSVEPCDDHTYGFESQRLRIGNCTDGDARWQLEEDAAAEKEVDIDLQAPDGSCDPSRVRVMGHVDLTDDRSYCAGITHRGDHFLTHVRKSGWFDCGDLLPRDYTIEVFARTDAGLDVIAKETVKIEKQDRTQVVRMTRK